MPHMTTGFPRIARAFTVAVLIFCAAYAAVLLSTGPILMDELEFALATKWVSEGRMPYRDFWEHHLPLQWFLMAPAVPLVSEASVSMHLQLRALQTLFFGGGIVAITVVLLRRKRVSLLLLAAAGSLLLTDEMFSRAFTEFRIDVPMNFFYLLGILFAEEALEHEDSRCIAWRISAAGLMWGLACLASQRMVPAAVATWALYAAFLILGRRMSWGIPFSALMGLLPGLILLLAYSLKEALPALIEQNVNLNASYEKLGSHGQLPSAWKYFSDSFSGGVNPSRIVFWSAVFATILSLILKTKLKDVFASRLLILTAVQVVFIASISSPFPYQWQTGYLLLLLLVCTGFDRAFVDHPARRTVVAAMGSAVALLTAVLMFRFLPWEQFRDTLAYQDFVMKSVDRICGPNETVLDGSGYAVNREPLFRYWFLPRLVRVMTQNGVLEPLTKEDFVSGRPCAVLMHSRTVRYLAEATSESETVARNFLPLDRTIWIPAPNALLETGAVQNFTILRRAKYFLRVVSREHLVPGAWFSNPYSFAFFMSRRPVNRPFDIEGVAESSILNEVSVTIDGRTLSPEDLASGRDLQPGQELAISNHANGRVAVFVVPAGFRHFFQTPFSTAFPEASFEL